MAGIITQTYKVEVRDALESPSAVLYYLVTGTESETDVYALVQGVLQATFFNFFLTDYSFNHVGGGKWEVKVTYGGTMPQTDGTVTYSLDFTGGTDRRRQSFATTAHTASYTGVPDGTHCPDYGGAINVRGIDVEGVEVATFSLEMTVTQYITLGNMIPNFLQNLADLEGTINDAEFTILLNDLQPIACPEGCCLFRGATITQKGFEAYCVTWKLSILAEQDYSIGNIPTFTKAGWDYLWVQYTPTTSDSTRIPQPKTVYVEEVYERTDFSLLAIPGG